MTVPAAQYLRMSTEHQQYSLANQTAKIQEYAQEHGFRVVNSYVDSGRSGIKVLGDDQETGIEYLEETVTLDGRVTS